MTRVLIVEDDPIIALDLAEQLVEEGFVAVGPASNVRQGLELLATEGCDVAVLDVNLGAETSEAVALELMRRAIPFVRLSGYSSDQHPQVFNIAPLLVKPVRMSLLVDALRKTQT
jgi:DNA-binding response OmpR family regulator